MAVGGYTKLPNGTVVVAITLPRPGGADGDSVRVVVHAATRQRALTRLRNLGFRHARLNGNAEPPTHDETTAVLHHPDGVVWRPSRAESGPWRSIAALRRAVDPR